jgi:hypothetical protein
MTARIIRLSAVRGSSTHAVLTSKRIPIGYGSKNECESYVDRKQNQKAFPGLFVQALAQPKQRVQYRVQTGTYACMTLRNAVISKGTQSEMNEFARKYAIDNRVTVKVAIVA